MTNLSIKFYKFLPAYSHMARWNFESGVYKSQESIDKPCSRIVPASKLCTGIHPPNLTNSHYTKKLFSDFMYWEDGIHIL